MNRWLVVALVIVLAVLVLRLWDFRGLGPLHEPDVPLRPQNPVGDLAGDEKTTIALFKAAKPSVVNITTTAFRRDRFTLNPIEIPQGTGTGFVWTTNDKHTAAYIVTNFHVIQEASRAKVTLADGSTENAEYVGGDPDNDLAVLRIPVKDNLAPLELGTSKDLEVGQKVFAIGNPFGLDHSLTTGVISGLGREIEAVSGRTIHDVIQTDAAINPGNSGGPLLDSHGNLIGVNTAIYSPSGANAGVGFAIPVDTVNHVVTKIIQGKAKTIECPVMGVQIANYVLRDGKVQGVLVVSVLSNGPAQAAGLKGHDERSDADEIGDVILAVDGKETKNVSQLQQIIESHKAGDKVTLTILRGGQKEKVEVGLVDRRPSGSPKT